MADSFKVEGQNREQLKEFLVYVNTAPDGTRMGAHAATLMGSTPTGKNEIGHVGHIQNLITLANAVVITDTLNHDFDLITQGGLTEDVVRRYSEFKVSAYNTHNQAATLSLFTANRAVGAVGLSASGTLYTAAANLAATSGNILMLAGATATGADSSQKSVPALKGIHSNLAVRVAFATAPASGALTIVIEMQ